ncbi:type IV secretory system conjugative DNA transfer family protein [Nocardia salmonicida]|uniref:type IV secretory system conjugative DNA transfer family protein n=1 Tax=Nocardia salmonicida TaxID=53431 RepID=UPI0037ADF6EE
MHGHLAVLILLTVVSVLVMIAFGSWHLAAQFTGDTIPSNPWMAFGRSRYRAMWTPLATVFTAIAEFVVIGAAAIVAARVMNRGSEIDRRAKVLTSPRQLTGIAGPTAVAKAQRLRPDLVDVDAPGAIGLHLGQAVHEKVSIAQSYEDTLVGFAGPRTGKTAGAAIGSVIDAPGPVLATSNKRDLRDHTRGLRETNGRRVWESDLQGITGAPHQDWFWNPFKNLTSLKDGRRLAGRFIDAETIDGGQVNSYFDGGAAELIALYFLASSVGGGDVLHSYAWLSDADNPKPAALLRAAGHPIAAEKMRTAQGLNRRQRDGLYDVARRNLNVLTEPTYLRTVLPPTRIQIPGDDSDLARYLPTHDLPEFDLADFVRSSDALYALSMEGADSASALTTALVGAIIDEALKLARRSGGRLPVPLVAVLDEAANVCKLSELPAWYSHLGSQGVICQTWLQSPQQGRRVWSDGLDQLVSASNLHYYGGGVKDNEYLGNIAQAIGNHDVQRWSQSFSAAGGRSHSQSWSAELAMPVSVLAEMDIDRAIVLSTGNAPVLIKKAWWSDRPDAHLIEASAAKYGVTQEVSTTKELL